VIFGYGGCGYSLYGETIPNTVEYASAYAGSGSALAAFTLAEAPIVTAKAWLCRVVNLEMR
jgi:hypothetical protein